MDVVSRKYMSQFPQSVSKIKLVILLTLLEEGVGFPRGWVESSKLMYLTNQKNFDQHVDALREEYGCDIETKFIGGQKSFRLRSVDRLEVKPKTTLEQAQKDALLHYSNNSCQICGAKLVPGQRDLQTDQKIPEERGGNKGLDNWQVICNDCLVNKRRSCNQCEDNCSECSWAFPDRVDGLTIIRIPVELSEKLKNAGVVRQSDIENLVIRLLESTFAVKDTESEPPSQGQEKP